MKKGKALVIGFACAASAGLGWQVDREFKRYDRAVNAYFLGGGLMSAAFGPEFPKSSYVPRFEGNTIILSVDFSNNGIPKYKNLRVVFSADFAEGGQVCQVSYDIDDPAAGPVKSQKCQNFADYTEKQQEGLLWGACAAAEIPARHKQEVPGAEEFSRTYCPEPVPGRFPAP